MARNPQTKTYPILSITHEGNDPVPRSWYISLDGKDISHCVRNIEFKAGVDYGSTRAIIELYVRPDLKDIAVEELTEKN